LNEPRRHTCKRCGTAPPQWANLSPAARRVVASLTLGRDDVEQPATPADADDLRAYYRHQPHTNTPATLLRRRAVEYLADCEVAP